MPLRVVSSGAFAPAYSVLVPIYERRTGFAIESLRGPSLGPDPTSVPNRLRRGEDIDVVIMSGPGLTQMIAEGLVSEGTGLARSLIGLAVREGAGVPDISTPEALRAALLAASSIGTSVSVSGAYVRDTLLGLLGIADAVRDRVRIASGEPVAAMIARGEVELGFQQISELKPVSGITLVGKLPDAVQQETVFSAGLVAAGRQQEAARALIRFLASADAAPAIIESGMEPMG
jgi:molybdate transport system substrate-binding protein